MCLLVELEDFEYWIFYYGILLVLLFENGMMLCLQNHLVLILHCISYCKFYCMYQVIHLILDWKMDILLGHKCHLNNAFYFLIKGILGILLLNSNYYHIYYHKVNLSYIHHTLILRIMNLYYQSHLMYLLITLMDIINYCKLLFYMVYAMYAYC